MKEAIKLIKIRAHVDSTKETIEVVSPDKLDIHLKEPAADNRANKRIMEIMRSMHKGRAVRMIKGHHSASKIISVA